MQELIGHELHERTRNRFEKFVQFVAKKFCHRR